MFKGLTDCEQSLIFFAKLLLAKPKHASGELSREPREMRAGVSPKRKSKRPSFLVSSQSLIVITTSWFAIALDEIRTRRILREKADCKQSKGLTLT